MQSIEPTGGAEPLETELARVRSALTNISAERDRAVADRQLALLERDDAQTRAKQLAFAMTIAALLALAMMLTSR